MPREVSQVLVKVFDALKKEGCTRADVARELCLYQDDIDNLTFGLVLSSVPSIAPMPVKVEADSRPSLRLVK